MRKRVPLLLCPLLLAAIARPARATIQVTETSDPNRGGRNDGIINIAECNGIGDSIGLAWTVAGTPDANWSKFHVYATASDCAAPTTVTLTTDVAVTSGSASGTVSGIDVRSKIVTALGLSCSGTATDAIALCVSVLDSGGVAISGATDNGTITLDPTVPDPPQGVGTSPGDGALHVNWTAASTGAATADSFTATATPVAPDATHVGCNAGGSGGSCTVTGGGSTSCRIDGLTNFACYDVSVVAYSAPNNPSAPSATAVGVPMPVDDFWRHYLNSGGRERGGCGGPAGLAALLFLAPFLPRLRRRAP